MSYNIKMDLSKVYLITTKDINESSQTILNIYGKVIFFGYRDFIDRIVNGDCCFICGEKPETKEFNNEHIIPKWILKIFNLYSRTITLPNKADVMYGKYTVPCCKECNMVLGKTYEKPISKLLSKSYTEIVERITTNPQTIGMIYKWLCLIYLKTHLKDTCYNFHLDSRKGKEKISDIHSWHDLHHLHCIARSHYTEANIEDNVVGTLIFLPIIHQKGEEKFNYMDFASSQVILLQLNEFCIISALNDCCAGTTFLKDLLSKIKFPLTKFQVFEIIANLIYIYTNLKKRPEFFSSIKPPEGYKISAKLPKYYALVNINKRAGSVGEILKELVQNDLSSHPEKDKILREIKENRRSYLFNEKGEILDYSKSTIA